MSVYGSSLYERASYVQAQEAPLARWLFQSKAAAWVWLAARMWLGYAWLSAGYAKVFGPGQTDWMNGGEALRAAAAGAAAATRGAAAEVFPGAGAADGMWLGFLQLVQDNAAWAAKVVAVGELAAGAALLLGVFTGAAAFVGLVVGSAAVGGLAGAGGLNPLVVAVAVLLVLAWRNAGWVGLDRFLLRGAAVWSRGDYLTPRPSPRIRALRY